MIPTRRRRAGRGRPRRGAAAVEVALVCPVLILLILGTLIMGLGIFRLQQLEALAREGARWAAVRGPSFRDEHSQPELTAEALLEQAIRPRLVALDPDELSCTLTMTEGSATVVLRYRWVPEAFFPPVVLERRAVAPITY